MSRYYYIKFYHETLDDSKVATLPDRLWRRFFELCLIAGIEDKEGSLPDTQQIAWRLRMHTDDLKLDLDQLSAIGLVEKLTDGWLVVNFAKRQAPVSGSERIKQHREREKHEQYEGEDVTHLKRNVTQESKLIKLNKEISNKDKETVSFTSNICELYSNYIGEITPLMEETLLRVDKEYPAEWFPKAFEIMRGNSKKSWSYVEGILKNWKAAGIPSGNGRKKKDDRVSVEGRTKYGEWEK